jgi:hypothetical protein
MAQLLDTSLDELRNYDPRQTVRDLKRIADSDPRYGVAFRRVFDKEISPDELLDFAKSRSQGKKKK